MQHKKIVFDLSKTQPIGNHKFHGGGLYGEIVYKALIETTNNVVAWYNPTLYINQELLDLSKKKGL